MNVVVVIVRGSIASLKTAAIFPSIATPVAALTGTVKLTVGEVLSAAGIANPTVLESKVTGADRANSRPSSVAADVTVREAKPRMFHLQTQVLPRVAERPTCQ